MTVPYNTLQYHTWYKKIPFSSYLVQSSILECVCLKHSVYLTMSRSLYFPTFPTSTLTANSLNILCIKFNILPIVLHCNISSITRVDTAPSKKLSKLNTNCDRLTCAHLEILAVKTNLVNSTVSAYEQTHCVYYTILYYTILYYTIL